MAFASFILDNNNRDHEIFLKKGLVDKIQKRPFQEGDEIVFCSKCEEPILLNPSWEHHGRQHCNQAQTFTIFPIEYEGVLSPPSINPIPKPVATIESGSSRKSKQPFIIIAAILLGVSGIAYGVWSAIWTSRSESSYIMSKDTAKNVKSEPGSVISNGPIEPSSLTSKKDSIGLQAIIVPPNPIPTLPINPPPKQRTSSKPSNSNRTYKSPNTLKDYWPLINNSNIDYDIRTQLKSEMIRLYFISENTDVVIMKGGRIVEQMTISDLIDKSLTSPSLRINERSKKTDGHGKIELYKIETSLKETL